MDSSAISTLHFLSLKAIRSQSLEFQRIINEGPEEKDHGLFSAKGFSSSIKVYNLSMKKHESKVKHFWTIDFHVITPQYSIFAAD